MGGARRILLVDDVVTRGSTLLGCAARLGECSPGLEVAAFAVARVAEVDLSATQEMLTPKLEVVRRVAGHPMRVSP